MGIVQNEFSCVTCLMTPNQNSSRLINFTPVKRKFSLRMSSQIFTRVLDGSSVSDSQFTRTDSPLTRQLSFPGSWGCRGNADWSTVTTIASSWGSRAPAQYGSVMALSQTLGGGHQTTQSLICGHRRGGRKVHSGTTGAKVAIYYLYKGGQVVRRRDLCWV